MQLFHASKFDLSDGVIIEATSPTLFYPDAVLALEKHRPDDAPSRSACLFASDNQEFSVFFLLGQQTPLAEIRIYEVEMQIFWKSPIAIVHALQRRIENSAPTDSLISEYWSPSQQWNFYEIFGPKMTIKKKLPTPSLNEILLTAQYGGDSSRAKNL